MSLKILSTQDVLIMESNPSLIERLVFWKRWVNHIELPISLIYDISIRYRKGVRTAYIKAILNDSKRKIPFSIDTASQKELIQLKEIAYKNRVDEQIIFNEHLAMSISV